MGVAINRLNVLASTAAVFKHPLKPGPVGKVLMDHDQAPGRPAGEALYI